MLHHLSRSTVYRSWTNMKARCDNPRNTMYHYYGGRGITYDPAWKNFISFIVDMGPAKISQWLDRIDSNKGYNKANCRWANISDQAYNHRQQINNVSGITGVSYLKAADSWLAYFGKNNTVLYRGKDFFEACCARKSWEFNCKGII